MTRNGKIARLPRYIRDELNQRLDDGETGKALVDWLNARESVKEVLAEEFRGRPITEQNLSEWKAGGFVDWRKQQEEREWVRGLAEDAEELEAECGESSLADHASTWVALAMARMLREGSNAGAWKDPEQRGAVLAIARELTQLRRANHEGEHLRLRKDEAQVDEEQRRVEELDKMERQMSADRWKPIRMLLDAFSMQSVIGTLTENLPPEAAKMVRDYIDHPDRDPTMPSPEMPDPPAPDPTESD